MEVELDAQEEERLKRLKTQRDMEKAFYQRRRYKAQIAYWAWSATLPELGEIMPNGEPACSRGKGWSASDPEDFPRCPEVLMQFKRLLEGELKSIGCLPYLSEHSKRRDVVLKIRLKKIAEFEARQRKRFGFPLLSGGCIEL